MRAPLGCFEEGNQIGQLLMRQLLVEAGGHY